MWNTMWKTCEKCPIFTLFSHIFHTFFTHFSHAFHTHISRACEILHSEIYVKRVWSDVIPFTHIFTYTSHGVSHRLSHVNPHVYVISTLLLLCLRYVYIMLLLLHTAKQRKLVPRWLNLILVLILCQHNYTSIVTD